MTDKKTEALKLALEALEGERVFTLRPDHEGKELTPAKVTNAITAIHEALAEQPAQQEPVACAVCNEVHTILDTDESKIIRSAADGYPEGRTPRVLTLQERVIALCVYAADWKRWCIEKENASPAQQQEPVAWLWELTGEMTTDPDRADGMWLPLYTSQPVSKPWVGLTDEEIKRMAAPWFLSMYWTICNTFAREIEAKLRERNA